MHRLKDFDDDVRSVASETLLPVAKDVVRLGFDKMSEILSILWDILLELDDLTSSTNSVMNLLAELYSIPATSDATNRMLKEKQQNSSIHPLTFLVPRLWQFLLHNIASVRLATLNTLLKLLTLNNNSPDCTAWIIPILPDALCYIFQTILLESKPVRFYSFPSQIPSLLSSLFFLLFHSFTLLPLCSSFPFFLFCSSFPFSFLHPASLSFPSE